LNSTAWVVGLVQQVKEPCLIDHAGARTVIKDNTTRNLESNSTSWVVNRAHG